MLRNICFLLCLTVHLSYVTSFSLTREINLAEKVPAEESSPQILKETLGSFRDADTRRAIVGLLLDSPQQAVVNIAGLLTRKNRPEASEILDAFNDGLGSKLLIIENDYVKVDNAAFDNILSESARALARILYPSDYFQELIAYSVFQQQVTRISTKARPVIESTKIPLRRFDTALIATNQNEVLNRSLQQRDIFSDIVATVQSAVCDTIISALYGQVNQTLTSAITFLGDIEVATSSDDILSGILSAVVGLVIDLATQAATVINEYIEAESETICSLLLNTSSTDDSTRKRRDVLIPRSEVQLSQLAQRDILSDITSVLEGILSALWSLVSPLLNSLLTSLVDSLISYLKTEIDSFLDGTLTTSLYGIVNTFFPTSTL